MIVLLLLKSSCWWLEIEVFYKTADTDNSVIVYFSVGQKWAFYICMCWLMLFMKLLHSWFLRLNLLKRPPALDPKHSATNCPDKKLFHLVKLCTVNSRQLSFKIIRGFFWMHFKYMFRDFTRCMLVIHWYLMLTK